MVVKSNFHNGKGIVRGNIFSDHHYITKIPSGITITAALLTVKTNISDNDPGIFQKSITSADVPGTGQIENSGTNGTATLRFDLTSVNTLAMIADVQYLYDIRVTLSTGDVLTVENGETSSQNRVGTV